MMLLLFLLALAMILTGIASAVFGVPILQLERGTTMVLGGSGVASAGMILFGLTFVCYRLKKIQREIRRLGDRLIRQLDYAPLAPAAPAPPAPMAERPRALPPDEGPEDAELLPPVAPPPAGPPKAFAPDPPTGATVVGRYASGGNAYVMYSDGSIHADTPSGHHRFSSLDDLKAFVAAGGERQG